MRRRSSAGNEGDVLSLDSGGNYHGYIGDVARMAVLGEPDAELVELLDEIEEVQRAAFAADQARRHRQRRSTPPRSR